MYVIYNVHLVGIQKISWTDHVRNEVILTVKEQRKEYILHQVSKRKANLIGHILRR
jgi:hypothetical protein